jgi:hypothetical protein
MIRLKNSMEVSGVHSEVSGVHSEVSGVDPEVSDFCYPPETSFRSFGSKIPTETSEERKPENFTKFRAKKNYCVDGRVKLLHASHVFEPSHYRIFPSTVQVLQVVSWTISFFAGSINETKYR